MKARNARYIQAWTKALDVLGDPLKATQWMGTDNHALGEQTPISLLETDEGLQQVEAILGRIEHGIFS